ncbi:hypothetical protein GCM10007989_03410 [Devosia pacifica]|uniref:DUF4174 domain-containing protein n=1 Tax=Devosia pacifica TaxID=1335967 RepID=A0A918VP93_9HYPH|nr:DUF4174 domain-containing protein [Devosia pacifica]GHA12280.1 hypothetical protein GCM10007989_03410 [Devosia pacifica]
MHGLEEYRWKYRTLLLFGEDEDPAVQNQLDRIRSDIAGFRDRDMIVVQISGSRTNVVAGDVSPSDGAALRKNWHNEPQFAVVLVGKDGGEKLRRDSPVAIEELFALVDSMPMRQSEMRNRS